MKIRYFIIILVLLWSCSIPFSFKKNEERSKIKLYSHTLINESQDEFDISLYAFIPYDYLVFTKKQDRFFAEIELSLTVTDLNSNLQVYNYSWNENVEEEFYDDTRNRKKTISTFTTFCQPEGEYRLSLNVQDTDSRHQWNVNQNILVQQFEIMSDVIPLTKQNDSLRFVGPRFQDDIDTLFCKFQISEELIDENLSYSVMFGEEELLFDSLKISDIKLEEFCLLPIPLENNWSGKLKIQLKLMESVKEISVFIKRHGMDKFLIDIDEAVGIIALILSDVEFKKLEKLSKMEQKLFIVDYWKKKDPSPDTDKNELMEEFYNRVEEANQHFSTFGTGWRTDRGRIFIVHGQPDNVETTRRSSTAIYQIWTYPDNRQFIFKDNGFGEFRLIQGVW
ncbi:MAG: GWxTD domain-containing protein [Candidatus Marinimicrobia bacterium]|nr:GWxTD domain-containing protein [Candidatus Neomarinimicrobiota bacterium]MBL7023095.1 GWxTD domain-containing protein [Candidatus Neomarinimicrobiota bacterium]MBL7109115.1 GWxTD domain-containing protein [Candidatus Neomarinimicrobiota bacterium]